MVSYYDDELPQALLALFPEIGLDKSKLQVLCMLFALFTKMLCVSNNPPPTPLIALWHKEQNRRAFFEAYAHENAFYPLDPVNWYMQPLANIRSYKVSHLPSTHFVSLHFPSSFISVRFTHPHHSGHHWFCLTTTTMLPKHWQISFLT